MTVFVGPSIWRGMDVRTATAMFASMASNPTGERVVWAPLWNDALIGRSRSIMCSEFLRTDADVMVIIDDDIVWEPPDFWKIVEGARATRDVYGGAYVTRSTEPHISSRRYPGTRLEFAQTPQRRPVEFQYLATGFMAIHRDVMDAMLATEFVDAYGTHRVEEVELGADRPFVPFFQPFVCREDDGRLHYLSEDWAFSNRARQAGHRVWVDQSIILLHMGWYPFTVRDLKDIEEGLPSTGIDRVEVEVPQAATGDRLVDDVIAEIAEFTGDDVGDIRRMTEPGVSADALNRLWLTRAEGEADWYRREDVGLHYLTDLAGWHRRGNGCPLSWMDDLTGKLVVDYGAGIGSASLAAARAGATVVAVEINPVLREFISFRAQRHGLSLTVIESLDGVEGQVDALIAWHVYEHLEHPEVALAQHRELLRDGGLLLSDSGFADSSCAQHHVRTDWEDVLAAHGFVAESDARYRYEPARELVSA